MTSTTWCRPTNPWLPYQEANSGVPLYCLPHAGGAASAFRAWIGRLHGVAVRPLQPPGRETRKRETAHTDIAALAADLADVVLADAEDRPYAVYGHSLGALVGFELLHRIRRIGGRPPAHFLLSACRAPHLFAPDALTTADRDMSQERIVAWLRSLGGTPESFLSDPRVLAMILPPVRADLSVMLSYRYEPLPPLDVPITSVAATDDPRANPETMGAWRDQTVGRFELHTLSGGHFAVFDQAEATLEIVRRALCP